MKDSKKQTSAVAEVVPEANETRVVIQPTPTDLISEAISKGSNLADLKELLAMKKDYEANEARKLYASSFAKAQANISAVVKSRVNPQTHSKYADLADIIESSQPVYTKEGFSMIFYEGDAPVATNIRVCVNVLHSAGHMESYHYDSPIDGVGIKGASFMTATHAKASSVAYGRRYLQCMVWNIPTSDNDGNQATPETAELITPEQAKAMTDLIATKEVDTATLLKFLKVDAIEKIKVSDYQKAMEVLKARKTKKVADENK